jgi:hypothetical protein
VTDIESQPTPVKSKRTWKTWQLLTAALLAFLIGTGVGAAGSSEDEPENAASVETTSTTEEVDRESTTTTEGSYNPAPADFVLTVVTTEQSCFGSAGCNVTYQIDVTYKGPRPLDGSDTWVLIYEVRGGEDLKVGNITVKGDQFSREDDMISTGPGPRLEAVVTTVREG